MTDDKLSWKWAWSRHVIHFKFQGPKHTSGITEAIIAKFRTQVGSNVTKRTTYHPLNGCGYGHVTCFKILPFAVMQLVAWVRQRQLSYMFTLSMNTFIVVDVDMQTKVDDHRRKWDRSEFEKLASERLAAEEREVKSSSSRDVGRREPTVKRDLLKPRDYKVFFVYQCF